MPCSARRGHAHPAQVQILEPRLAREVAGLALRGGGFPERVAVLHLVLPVDHERDVVERREAGRQALLAEDEGLERVQEVLEGEPGEGPVHPPVGRAEVVVEARVQPRLEVAPAHLRVDVGRPRHGERIHAVLVLEQVRGVDRVLAPAARHQDVVPAVGAAVAGQQVEQLALAGGPVDALLLLREAAGRAHAGRVEVNRLLLRFAGVRVLDGGRRALVGDHAARAEAHVRGQAELRLERRGDLIGHAERLSSGPRRRGGWPAPPRRSSPGGTGTR